MTRLSVLPRAPPPPGSCELAAVWARARADLRTRWKAWLMLAILVGLAAGGVIAAAAGARRTDTAFPRFAQAERAPNVMLLVGDPTFAQFSLEQVAHLPQVAGVATLSFYSPADRSLGLGIAASPDDRLGTTVLRHKILAGRLPRQDRPDEVLVSFLGAEHRHLAVGDRLSENVLTSLTRPPVTVSFQIVGIEANPIEFPPLEQSPTDNLWATPAFWRAHATQLALATDTIALRPR